MTDFRIISKAQHPQGALAGAGTKIFSGDKDLGDIVTGLSLDIRPDNIVIAKFDVLVHELEIEVDKENVELGQETLDVLRDRLGRFGYEIVRKADAQTN